MKYFTLFLSLLLMILILFLATNFFYYQLYFSTGQSAKDQQIFLVQTGQSSWQIGEMLEKEGLIKNKILFNLYLILTRNYKKLQTGRYLLNSSMTIPEIAKKMVKGEVIKEKITIIEGWDLLDIAFYLKERKLFSINEFFDIVGFPASAGAANSKEPLNGEPRPLGGPLLVKNFSNEFDFLRDKPKDLSLEGYLFPDTYEIRPGENVESVVKKMLANFDRKLGSDVKEEIKKQKKTTFEIVTMASMLEKEVRTIADKKIVAGVLWKRLESKVPLQVDAAIAYLTRKKSTIISAKDLGIDSSYNTYKYRGLPPGPISNPGLESIMAAVYPQKSDYWYYLSTPEGKTIFSRTFKEHNQAIAKYLR